MLQSFFRKLRMKADCAFYDANCGGIVPFPRAGVEARLETLRKGRFHGCRTEGFGAAGGRTAAQDLCIALCHFRDGHGFHKAFRPARRRPGARKCWINQWFARDCPSQQRHATRRFPGDRKRAGICGTGA